MPPPANVNELLELVRKSGLIEDARLRTIVANLRTVAHPAARFRRNSPDLLAK